jgi:hypothetical protein
LGHPVGRPVEVLVARVTLPATTEGPSGERDLLPPQVPSRRDLQVARRLRRRDALLGLGVLAAALGATVLVLVVH